MTGDDSTRLALLERDVEYLKTEAQEELKYYVNNKLLSESKVVLANPVKNITVKISNPTERFIDVKTVCVICSKSDISE